MSGVKHQAKRRKVTNETMQSMTAYPLEVSLCEALTSSGCNLASTLIYHLLKRIQIALNDSENTETLQEEHVVSISVEIVKALLNTKEIQTWTNKTFSETGTALVKALTLFRPEMSFHEAVSPTHAVTGEEIGSTTVVKTISFQQQPLCIQSLLSTYEDYLTRNKRIYEHITTHHQEITAKDWQSVTKDDEALNRYCEAANAMGEKVWVYEANQWMAEYCIKFFHQHGMKKYFQRRARASGATTTTSTTTTIATADNEETPIRLLDVGSCYNPIVTKFHKDISKHFEVTAMDLCPADEEHVLKGDFLTLTVGKPESDPVIVPADDGHVQEQEQVLSKLREVKALPAGRYHAVTMSLVLSYLPTPEAREVMVEKTRQLLMSGDKESETTGLFLIVEKQSILATPSQKAVSLARIGNGNEVENNSIGQSDSKIDSNSNSNTQANQAAIVTVDDWKNAICSRGFHCVTYQFLPTSDGRKSHVFVFAATNEPSSLDPMKHRMLIKQEVIQK